MPSRTIRPTEAPEPAPFAYTVAAPEGFTPEAVFASWDGSGAGGDFLPCVSYYNADGVLLDRAFPTTGAVTAGDSADVGYRPFERGGGASAPAVALLTDAGGAGVPTTEITFGNNLNWANLGGGHVRVTGNPSPAIPTQWVRHAVFTGNFSPAGGPFQEILWDTIQSTFYTPEAAWAVLPPGGSVGAGITVAGQYLVIASVMTDPVLNRNEVTWNLLLNGFVPAGAPGVVGVASFTEDNPGVSWLTQANMFALATLPAAPGSIELALAVNNTGHPLTQGVRLNFPGAQLSVIRLSP